jgi:hypothetical protein
LSIKLVGNTEFGRDLAELHGILLSDLLSLPNTEACDSGEGQMKHRPEDVARYTVEQNGGEYTTSVRDLLALFGCEELTDRTRWQIDRALLTQGVQTDPELLETEESESVRLFLVEPAPAAVAPRRRNRLRPRTWKGWTAYGVAALLILAAIPGDSEGPGDSRPAADSARQAAESRAEDNEAAQRAELRRERTQIRTERAQLRRERAEARRVRARKALAARRRERERREQLQAQAAPPAAEPEPAANCHSSYDPCLDPNASDYDCEDGSGDGPEYTGFVTVKGPDDYDLDSDGDGTGCES